MTFKSPLWQPIAVVLSAINLVAVGVAAGAAEPWHAAAHAGLGLAFGLWAQRLRYGLAGGQGQARLSVLEADLSSRMEALEGELSDQRRELTETQERLDFAERLLAQGRETHRVGLEP
jgi:hypothetical protein